MSDFQIILAEGIPPGVLFAAAIAIVVAIANAVAKKKQNETMQEKLRSQRHARENRSYQTENQQREADAREMRKPMDRDQSLMDVIREQMRRNQQQQAPQRQTQQPSKKKGKQRQTATPPPMPGTRAVAATPKPVESEPAIAMVSRSAAKTETARNVRMLLQPSGIREAFILSEVMGKPKALRDE